jgi:hypothetical protein
LKGFENQLKIYLENQLGNKKEILIQVPSLPPFGPVGLLAIFLARPRFSPLLP